ncbi:MAG: glycoside hydrolase family 38 C-terminal domain-containing protein [Bacillota bacterium]
MPDGDHPLGAVYRRILELGAWRNLAMETVGRGTFQSPEMAKPVPFGPGDPWPSRAFPVRIALPITIPMTWAGQPVRLHLDVDGEALLCVNGRPLGGLLGPPPAAGRTRIQVYQREYELTGACRGGETFRVEVEAVPRGRFGVPVREPRFRQGFIAVPDLQVRALYEDLLAVWDVAQHMDSAAHGAYRTLLTELLEAALAELDLPAEQTRPYLAGLGRDSQAAGLVGEVWEDWDLEAQGSPAPLTDAHRQSLERAAKRLREGVADLGRRFRPEGALTLAGHAHIDLAWLWPLDETRRKARRTFSSVLYLMDRHPEMTFAQSMAQLYAFVEEDDPELFRRIQDRVREGRWEPIGGMWVEPDCNLPSGESLARQLLHGQRYFQRAFGRRSRVAWLPDSFGFTGALPQLLVQAGIDFFFTTKLYWNDRDLFPYDLYWWEGIDGTRVLAHLIRNENQGYNGNIQAFDLSNTWQNFRGKARHGETLLPFGWGDGGGGPTEEMLERYERLKDFPGMPRSRMGRIEDFFERIDRTQPLPVWVGEQYLEFHRGTYTTQGRIKQGVRKGEARLYQAEALSALAARAESSFPYPREELTTLWQTLLRNQFHDIMPGSSVRVVNEQAERELAEVVARATSIREAASRALAARIPASHPQATHSLVVWNLSSRPRRLELEIDAGALPPTPFRLLLPGGAEVPYQRRNDKILVVGAQQRVNGVGYLALSVVPASPAGHPSPVRATANELENERLRVRVARDGTLASVYDKEAGREVLAGGGNQLWAYSDRPAEFEAWNLDEEYVKTGRQLTAVEPPKLVEAGPLQAAIEVVTRCGGARIVQRYVLRAGSPRLDVETEIEWTGRRTMLKAVFPVAVRSEAVTCETAFGAVSRPTHRNTSWDRARYEIPAHRWIDLSEGGYGVSLLNDGRYGHSALGNILGITLLRSPIHPDPYADEGTHRFTYSLYPHRGDWRNGTVDEAEALNAPLWATVADPNGDLPAEKVWLSVEAEPVRLSAIKLAEEGEELIVRGYEAYGSRGRALVRGEGPASFCRAVVTNLLEEPVREVDGGGSVLELPYRPYEVFTLKLRR